MQAHCRELERGPAKFGFFNDFEIVPILDVSEAVAVQNAALEWVEGS